MPVCVVAYSGRGRLAQAVAQALQKASISVVGLVDRSSANQAALGDLGIVVHRQPPTLAGWEAVLKAYPVRLIVLAGYLRLVPVEVVRAYPVLNSHPALLPAFGGVGFYGRRVHEAVIRSGATESGLTIHLASEQYDQGPILYQVRLPIGGLTAEAAEAFIQAVEREIYPRFVLAFWQKLEGAKEKVT